MRRGRRGGRTAALLTGLVTAVVLAGCGVPASDVIEAGAPAGGMADPSPAPTEAPASVSLFFPTDGDLRAFPRLADDAGDLGGVVRLLFEGPNVKEAAVAVTELPRLKNAPRVSVAGDGTVTVRLPGETAPLSRLAMLQLTCTVAYAAPLAVTAVPRAEEGPAEDLAPGAVLVSGNDWTMTQSITECPASP
ncbi:hypothetical protein ABZ368_25410 [Streptomyces sp. NPDC005908]|uniref:hypothetical protein n=1 Tax=unclassified Streptomyces TaxID=2593676 RepID=UPI00119F27F5|nr:hypothetical protein [Streptomyces sp. T12]TWD16176.1 hypothetical protein FB570_11254 [Streptomyces sp. T12]